MRRIHANKAGEPQRSETQGPPFVGRRDEWRSIEAAVRALGAGRRRLMILGEEGIGKSTLLNAAADLAEASGYLVVRASPRTGSLLAAIGQALPSGGGELAAARGGAGAEANGQVAATLAQAVRRAAAGAPVAFLIDDLGEADADELDALADAFGTLAAERFLFVGAATGPLAPSAFGSECAELLLGPLSDVDVAELADRQPMRPTGWWRGIALRYAGGNPLGIVALSQLTADAGPEPRFTTAIRLPDAIGRIFTDGLAALPERTRRALLYVSTARFEDDVAMILRAADVDLADCRPAEEAKLITIAGNKIAFRHPLARIACYLGTPRKDRQRAHRDLAALMAGTWQKAAHLASAADGPDETVAALLEEAAARASEEREHMQAAFAYHQAAAWTSVPELAAVRYAHAARMAALHGDEQWAHQLWRAAVRNTADPDVQGAALAGAGSGGMAPERLAAETDRLIRNGLTDRRIGMRLAAHMSGGVLVSGRPEVRAMLPGIIDAVERLDGHSEVGARIWPDTASDAVMVIMRSVVDPSFWRRLPESERRLLADGRARSSDGISDAYHQIAIGAAAWLADDSYPAVASLRRGFTLLREANVRVVDPFVQLAFLEGLLDIGSWPEAESHLAEAVETAVITRQGDLRAGLAGVAALQAVRIGDIERARALVADADSAASGGGERSRLVRCLIHRARATIAAENVDHERACRHFLAMFDADSGQLHFGWSYRAAAALAASAAAAGMQDVAAASLSRLRSAISDPSPRQRRLFGWADALLGVVDDDTAEASLAEASGPDAKDYPYEQATARVEYSQWLRARRRLRDARPLLSEAYETFARVGAVKRAASTRDLLRATGVAIDATADDPASEGFGQLTAQQQLIAALAARGLSNREIGKELRLSPRTVGSHLYQIYPKVKVANRHQLAAVVPDRAGTGQFGGRG